MRSALPARLGSTLVVLVAAGAAAVIAPGTASATTFEVTTEADSGPGSLRAAIAEANDSPGVDVITFAPDVSEILLASELQIDDSVEVRGPGSDLLTVGRANSDVFDQFTVNGDPDVTFRGLTISGQNGTGFGIYGDYIEDLTLDDVALIDHSTTYDGAAVYLYDVTGDITVTDSVFRGNSGEYAPSLDIYEMDGDLEISGTTFEDNVATDGYGAAVYLWGAQNVRILDSTFTGNEAQNTSWGGALFLESFGGLSVEGSVFSGNTASGGQGAAMYLDSAESNVTISASTFTQNDAFDGGAVSVYSMQGDLEVVGSTFADNTAGSGTGGASIRAEDSDGDVLLQNSTVDEQQSAMLLIDGSGTVRLEHATVVAPGVAVSNGYDFELDHAAVDTQGSPLGSIDGSVTADWSALTDDPDPADYGGFTDGDGNQFGVLDLGLQPLADNGGPTLTMLPLRTSVLVDTGDPDFAPPPSLDQRGEDRVVGSAIDIGAVELEAPLPPDPAHSEWSVAPAGPLVADGSDAYTATATVRDADDQPVAGVAVTFTTPADVAASSASCVTAADGTCSITLTSTVAGSYDIGAALDDVAIGDPQTVTFVAGPASAATSQIAADPATIIGDGSDSSLVTVTLFDAQGNPLTTSGGTVQILTTLGELGPVTDVGDGTYTAVLTSDQAGTATLSFTIDGAPGTATAQVTVEAAQTTTTTSTSTSTTTTSTTTGSTGSTSGSSSTTGSLSSTTGSGSSTTSGGATTGSTGTVSDTGGSTSSATSTTGGTAPGTTSGGANVSDTASATTSTSPTTAPAASTTVVGPGSGNESGGSGGLAATGVPVATLVAIGAALALLGGLLLLGRRRSRHG